MTERWQNIKGFPNYQVSDQGFVLHVRFGRRLRPWVAAKGYKTVGLSRAGESVRRSLHALVAEAFLGKKPKGHRIYFVDGDPRNCRASNLEYRRAGSHMRCHGTGHHRTRLTEADVRKIRRRYRRGGITLRELAEEYRMTRQGIHAIVARQTWKHLED